MTMTMTQNDRHREQVTRLRSCLLDDQGYRMDVNLWFRHKNEALFYIDSVGKVHGPMDQTYSIKLGPMQKSGKEIALRNEYLEESENKKWGTCNEFQRDNKITFREESKHSELLAKDVNYNKVNNCQKSYLTTTTNYIPRPSAIEVGNYSSSLTKQKGAQGVTVNIKAPTEVTEDSNVRERRLINELLETRNELNTLRRTKSVIDTSLTNDHSSNYYDVNYVSKVVTDVQPSAEKAAHHYSSQQDFRQNRDLEVRDTTVTKIQPHPLQSSRALSEETSRQTYINERQMAPASTYSAKKENIKSQQLLEDRHLESRTLQAERSMGRRNEITEEIETITLQPIGKGVQDLAPPSYSTMSRSGSRAAIPKVFEGATLRSNYYRDESKQGGNYNTMPSVPKFTKSNSVRNVNQASSYDISDFYKRENSTQRVDNNSFVKSSTSEQVQNIPFNNSSSNSQAYVTSLNRPAANEPVQNIPFNNSSSNSQAYITSLKRPAANEQVQNIAFNNSSSNGQAYASSLSKTCANEPTIQTLPNRSSNAQSINTSWHTRTESYSGGNQGCQTQVHPFSNQESLASNIIITSAEEDQLYNMQMVVNSENMWYKPDFTREDVIKNLKDKEPGNFYIRNSSTFAGAYGLALKVGTLPENAIRTNDAQSDLVRHFLIETLQEESGNRVRLKGFDNESVYSSLAHLVHAHCQNAVALPHTLILPETSFNRTDHINGGAAQTQYQYESSHQQQRQMESLKAPLLSQSHRSLSSPGVNFTTVNHPNPLHQNYVTNAMYLGKVEIDRLTGDAAIEHAVDKITSKSALKTSTVQIELDSTKGITLNDKMQKLFYTRQFPAQHVLYAGFDPKSREFSSPLLQSSGINRGRIMGIIVKRQKLILRENTVHLFCEIDGMTNLGDVLTFVKENYLRRV